MKKAIAIMTFVLFLALAAGWLIRRSEAHAQAGTPTLDQILVRYVQARGGRAAWEQLTSRVTTQTVTRRGQEEQVEIYDKAPREADTRLHAGLFRATSARAAGGLAQRAAPARAGG